MRFRDTCSIHGTVATLFCIASMTLWFTLVHVYAAKPEAEAMAAHRHGDSVSKPRFVAAMNDFMSRHPKDTVEGTLDHVRKVDKGDIERWHEVEQAWKELHDDYKVAGY